MTGVASRAETGLLNTRGYRARRASESGVGN